MRIAYLFTTFPVLSETFLQREIRAMRELPIELEIYSLHGGQDEFEGLPVRCFRKRELIALLWKLPRRLIERPRALLRIMEAMTSRRLPTRINLGENLLGIAFAILYADHFRKSRPDLLHAVWATMPATAAMLLREFTHVPYTMGAHAYDVFRGGGDWLLREKLQTARLIHTTTEATRSTLIERGASQSKVVMIRRGLHFLPEMKPPHPWHSPIRILAVGRLVEKKAYAEQLALYRFLKERGVPFEARIVGCGPQERSLRQLKRQLGLEQHVNFLGKREYTGVMEQFLWADVMLFTGKISRDGDRDGLPNVVPEAMAVGLPVISTPVSGVPEAIRDLETGLLVCLEDQEGWLQALLRLREDDALRAHITRAARQWVETHFCAHRNAAVLADKLRACASVEPGGEHNPYLAEEY